MIDAVKYCIVHALDFKGRDARSTFWYFVLFLVVAEWVAGLLFSIPTVISSAGVALDATARGGSQADVGALVVEEATTRIARAMTYSFVFSVITFVLFVAAFVRRLHDSDLSGWWAALPVAAQSVGFYGTWRYTQFAQANIASVTTGAEPELLPDPVMVSIFGLVPWIGYIAVIVLGVRKSTPGPNRYGEAPVAF